MAHRIALFVCVVCFVCADVACRSAGRSGARVVQPGAPGTASRVLTGAAPRAELRYTEADVRFMQGMIAHHAQALEMTALVPARTTWEALRLLARRIEVSQADEIRMMQQWLEAREQAVPDVHAHHAPGAPLMPGMLTAEEMAALSAARSVEFDRLFLRFMIRHHDGALIMVRNLLAEPGAAQDSDVFAFASDVEADQSIEIVRMRNMLASRQRPAGVPVFRPEGSRWHARHDARDRLAS